MVRTIAIITEKGVPCKGITENAQVNIFRMEDDKVLGYESVKLNDSDTDNFSKLLKIKEITLIYIETITNEMKRLLSKLGIGIKCKEEWDGDKFIEQFVFG